MAKSEHFLRSEYPPQKTMMTGYHHVIHQQLIKEYDFATIAYKTRPNETIYCSKTSDVSNVFFSKKSDEKIKKSIFVGSLILQLLDNKNFEATMDELELAT